MENKPGEMATLPDDVVALVPMRNVVLFPHVLMPISVGRPRSVAAVQHAVAAGAMLGIVMQRDARVDDPGRDALCDIGTLAKVVQHIDAEGQLHHAVCQGVQRFRIVALVEGHPFMAARIELIDEATEVSTQAEALGLQLRERAVEILSLLPGVPAELAHALQATRAPSQLADIVASLIDAEVVEKQMLLETLNTEERLHKVLAILSRRIEVLRLSQEIGERTKEQLDDRQRKFLLREQLKTIQKELGEEDEHDEDIARLDELITQAGMPAEVDRHARKELARLKRMSEAQGESSMLRTYLEWMTELPWVAPPHTPIELDAARRVLDADHHGLARIKQRIVEFLAVQKLNPGGRAP
jgi:ATP-dependent Lon protease